jgi:hypothetical protein
MTRATALATRSLAIEGSQLDEEAGELGTLALIRGYLFSPAGLPSLIGKRGGPPLDRLDSRPLVTILTAEVTDVLTCQCADDTDAPSLSRLRLPAIAKDIEPAKELGPIDDHPSHAAVCDLHQTAVARLESPDLEAQGPSVDLDQIGLNVYLGTHDRRSMVDEGNLRPDGRSRRVEPRGYRDDGCLLAPRHQTRRPKN